MKIKRISLIVIFIVVLIICAISIIYIINQNRNDENAAINLYKKIIDLTISENGGLSENNEYISLVVNDIVDPLNGQKFSSDARQELLNYCKKYNGTIYEKDHKELLEDGLGDDVKLKGCLITITLSSKSNNKATIYSKIYKGNMGSSMSKYYIKYNNKVWTYEDSGDKVQS